MRIDVDLFEIPANSPRDLGRTMDEVLIIAAGDTGVRHRVLDLILNYLPDLQEKAYEGLWDHLASCIVWWRIDDLNVYRTPGEPCLFFAAEQFDDASGVSEVRVHVLGAARRMSSGKDRDEWEPLILARCQSIGLCNGNGENGHGATG